MITKRVKRIIFIIILILLAGVAYSFNSMSWKNKITKYNGDGNIKSLKTGVIFKGYEVQFESFQLNHPYTADYEVSNLPKLKKSLVIVLRIEGKQPELKINDDKMRTIEDSLLTLKVNKKSGENIVFIKSKLKDWIKTSLIDSNSIDLYFMGPQKSSILDFQTIKGENFKVSITYEPSESDIELIDFNGAIIIRSGGHK